MSTAPAFTFTLHFRQNYSKRTRVYEKIPHRSFFLNCQSHIRKSLTHRGLAFILYLVVEMSFSLSYCENKQIQVIRLKRLFVQFCSFSPKEFSKGLNGLCGSREMKKVKVA